MTPAAASTSSSVVWEALGCLAGIDWTALLFWCLITFSLCLVSILLVSIFMPATIKEDEAMHPDGQPGQPPQGLDVFQQLFSQKLLPIDSSTGWQLTGVHHELRSWEKRVELEGSCYSLHGSCAVISSHAEGILETLRDTDKLQEWDNQVSGCSPISLPTTLDATDYPLMADVISLTLTCSGRTQRLSDALLDRLVALLTVPYNLLKGNEAGDPGYRSTHKPAVVARSWKMEDDTACWMFCRTVFKGKGHMLDEVWSYSLAQAAADDPKKSIMHHITCNTTSRRDCLPNERPALRLAALKQFFELKNLKVHPIHHTSLRHLTSHAHYTEVTGHSKGACGSWISSTAEKSGCYSIGESTYPSRETDASFLPIYNALDVNHSSKSAGASPRGSTWPVDGRGGSRARVGGGNHGVWPENNSSSDDAGFCSERREVTLRNRRQRVRKTMSAEAGGGGDSHKRDSLERKTSSLERHLPAENGRAGLDDSSVIDNLSDYQMIGQQGLELVLQESMRAACINVNAPEDDQKLQTGGWSFHCLEKDVVILKKPRKGKYYSFLGKGIIKASPESVYKAIRNPRTRFTYDTMLKKMNIVKNLSPDLSVYHMVHEVPQLLKKESRDFCVLEFCKTEGERSVVAFRSIDWPECPEVDSMVRGHILPSGWVIEPVGSKQNQYSMVTYIAQVAVCGKEVPSAFSQFLSVRVPLSVAYLRLFLEAQLP